MLRHDGIPTANWTVISDLEEMEEVCLPAVVKPADSGSSIGISIVEDHDSLQQAIKEALKYSGSSKILVEDKIVGREFSVGVLGKQVLPAIELIPKAGFYDYQNKYQIGRTEEIVPANIDVYLAGQMKDLALRIHQVLGLSVCSRSDFLIDENNNIYLIEVNSLPGMTPTSLLPQEAAAVGIDFEDLCERVVSESLLKYE